MEKLKLYLETSVWNFYYVEDSPEKLAVTRHFFDSQLYQQFDLHISETVLAEIKKATAEKQTQLFQLRDRYQPTLLSSNAKVRELAKAYLDHQVLPMKSHYDAQHIAFATVYELEVILSWNLKHIAHLHRQQRVQAINRLYGYTNPLQMITLLEVSHYE
jgi:hypothetical protein